MTFGSILFQANSDQKPQKYGKVECEMVDKYFNCSWWTSKGMVQTTLCQQMWEMMRWPSTWCLRLPKYRHILSLAGEELLLVFIMEGRKEKPGVWGDQKRWYFFLEFKFGVILFMSHYRRDLLLLLIHWYINLIWTQLYGSGLSGRLSLINIDGGREGALIKG